MKKCVLFITLLMLAGAASCKKADGTEVVATEAEATKKATPASEKYTVDTASSKIEWTGSKPTGKHTGTINLSGGEVFAKDGMLETGKFTIDMKSITVTDLKAGDGKEDLEAHLKGLKIDNADHFFNTNKYPVGTFEITGIAKEGTQTMIEGNLTLKGTTKNIRFPASVTVTGDEIAINSEPFKINRVLWNVNYNSKNVVENLGNQYIDDDIGLKVSVKAVK